VKDDAKFKDTQLKAANTIRTKATAIVASIEHLISNPSFEMVPTPISDPMKDSLSEFNTMLELASRVVAGDFSCEVPDAKVVVGKITAVKKQIAVVTPMVVSIGKTMSKLKN